MYNFSREYIKDIILELPHKIGKNCVEYKVEKNGELLGKILASDDFTFIDFENKTLKIDRDRGCLRNKKYSVINYQEEIVSATLEYLNTSNECIINIKEGSTYFFHKNQAIKKILNPKTWFKFEHHITDSKDDISFFGTYKINYLDSGIIRTTNEKLTLVVLIGLSILDEYIRTSQETAG